MKFKIHKSKIFLYTNNDLSGEKKKLSFTIVSRTVKYLAINLTRMVKDLCTEDYEALRKEIEEDTNEWINSLCSWIGRISTVKNLQTIQGDRQV